MPLLIRNILSVLLLQPARFVEPTPRTMRAWLVASVALSAFVCLQFPPQRLALAIGPIAVSMPSWPWARRWGSAGLGRPIFTLAWCLPVMLACSAMASNILVDLLAAFYLFAALTLQRRVPESADAIGREEREALVQARSALAGEQPAAAALTFHGTVALVELGPVIARWKGQDIPEWVVDEKGRTWQFKSTAADQDTLRTLAPGQMFLKPGAIYEQA